MNPNIKILTKSIVKKKLKLVINKILVIYLKKSKKLFYCLDLYKVNNLFVLIRFFNKAFELYLGWPFDLKLTEI